MLSALRLNGLRNPMERKDLSINSTEKIPLRSTLHQGTGIFDSFSPDWPGRQFLSEHKTTS